MNDRERMQRIFAASPEQLARIDQILDGRETVVSIAEAARKLGKSRYTIMRMVREGTLRAFRRNGHTRASGVYI